MEKFLGHEYNQEERLAYLQDNCDSTEEKGYMKPFTQEQISQKKEELANVSIRLEELEQKMKALMDELRAEMKPLKAEKRVILEEIKNKATYVNERVFKFIDFDNRQVGFYNAEGMLIDQRPAFGDELQGNIFNVNLKIANA
ncbi:hypothetical protein [Leadbetterella byssophila]|uniref:hypothetical protein n=1 Tax=Leadbetterella byssophila TaxID=316068 RepID=UPI0039A2CB9A